MTTAKIFYERNYKLKGSSFQRLYPNEELCRFIGRNFKKFSNIKKKNIKILEVGIGNATNLVMLGKEGFKIYGIDISEEAIKISRKTLAQSNLKSPQPSSDSVNFAQLPFCSRLAPKNTSVKFSRGCSTPWRRPEKGNPGWVLDSEARV